MTVFVATRIDGQWRVRCSKTGLVSPTVYDSEDYARQVAEWCEMLFALGARRKGDRA